MLSTTKFPHDLRGTSDFISEAGVNFNCNLKIKEIKFEKHIKYDIILAHI